MGVADIIMSVQLTFACFSATFSVATSSKDYSISVEQTPIIAECQVISKDQ